MSLLQQTREEDADADTHTIETAPSGPGRTVLDEVVERATARQEAEQEIRGAQMY